MLTVDKFEEAWKFLVEKYNLKNHTYMTQLFEIRHKWANLTSLVCSLPR